MAARVKKHHIVLRNGRRDILDRLAELLAECYRSETEYDVKITPHKGQRSLEQNSYFHGVVLKHLCEHSGHSAKGLKEWLKDECAEIVPYVAFDGSTRTRPQGTSDMNVGEMSEFIERCIALAAEYGVVIPPAPSEQVDYYSEIA